MALLKNHITFRIIAIYVALLILTPTFVKFTHVFSHHEHEVCLGEKTTHLHKFDADCDFYKFKLSNSLSCTFLDALFFSEEENIPKIISDYYFLSAYQNLHFSLRAPPVLV